MPISLKAVSPFIAHRAAIIAIPLPSFFRDEEWQGREVRSFRAQQGQWWVEDATFHFRLAARSSASLHAVLPFYFRLSSTHYLPLRTRFAVRNKPSSVVINFLREVRYWHILVKYLCLISWFFVGSPPRLKFGYSNKNSGNSLPLNVSPNSNWYARK